jgi:regulator of nucleoside diphosphate kinase
MEKRLVVTINDFKRLNGLMQLSQLKSKTPLIAEKLINGLKNARMFPQDKVSKNIVTMNSRVLLTEMSSGRQTEITISYPDDADNFERRVSVLSPIGVALLGRSQGDTTSWLIPGGWGEFKIEKVTYQPEAAGDYYL